MFQEIILPFATVLSAFAGSFEIFIGTEGAVAIYSSSMDRVVWSHPSSGRVEHVVYSNGLIYFHADGKLYSISRGADPLDPPMFLKDISSPIRMGVSSDGLIVLDYGSRRIFLDPAGFERNNGSGEIVWEGSFRDGSLEEFPQIKNMYLYHPSIGKVNPLFLLPYGDRWLVGTDGLGLLIFSAGSLFPSDTVLAGTLNGRYTTIRFMDGQLFIGGDRGIDIYESGRFNSMTLNRCNGQVDEVFPMKDGYYAAACGRIYRFYPDGRSINLTGNIGYDRIVPLNGRAFILYRGGLYEFTGRSIPQLMQRWVYDVAYWKGKYYAITDRGLISIQDSSEIDLDRKGWLDRNIRAYSDGEIIAICTRFGVMLYDGQWKFFEQGLGNVRQCEKIQDDIYAVASSGVWRLTSEKRWDRIAIRLNDVMRIAHGTGTIYFMTPRAIFGGMDFR